MAEPAPRIDAPDRPAAAALEVAFANLAARAETLLRDAVDAFERFDLALAARVVAADARVDEAHRALDARAFAALERDRPVGRDLRHAVTLLKVGGELERVGDLAKNVAKRTLVVARETAAPSAPGVARIGRESLVRLSRVLDAWSAGDVAAATAVWGTDRDLDALYNSVFLEILDRMGRDPGAAAAGAQLVFVAKNFERVGDHATNIAEALHFLVTGAGIEGKRPKDEAGVAAPRAGLPAEAKA